MGELTVGSVVLVDFPFSDYLHYKKRPALVVAIAEFDNYILCQITSKKSTTRLSVNLSNQDFTSGGLPQSSNIRPDKIYTVEKIIIEGGLGRINTKKLQQVKKSLSVLLGLTKNVS